MTCGKWTLLREIGRGAYGVVHMAADPDGRFAAVKVVERGDDPSKCGRELRGVGLFRNIPPAEGLALIIDFGETDEGFWYATELADDEFDRPGVAPEEYRPKTLAKVIAAEKALPLERAVAIGATLSRGLETLQRHHLLHRDIKPGNILFVRGKPVLSDPGLLVEEREAASLVGTPGYVPPESFVSPGSDIFSLGLTLKAASFGRPVEELDKGPSLEADVTDASFARWWQILNRATEKDESRRYKSAKAFLADLERFKTRMRVGGFLASRLWLLFLLLTLIAIVVLLFVLWRTTPAEVSKPKPETKMDETELETTLKSLAGKKGIKIVDTNAVRIMTGNILKDVESLKINLNDTLPQTKNDGKE